MRAQSFNGGLLQYLYERYEQLGPEPPMLSETDWQELTERTNADRSRIGRGFDELVADGFAEGHPRPGAGLRPRDGLVWIATPGRRLVESWLNPPPPLEPLQIEIARFGPEAVDQLNELFGQLDRTEVDRAVVEEVKQLLHDLNAPETDQRQRLAKAEQLVSLVAGSQQLLGVVLSHVAPIGDLVKHLAP